MRSLHLHNTAMFIDGDAIGYLGEVTLGFRNLTSTLSEFASKWLVSELLLTLGLDSIWPLQSDFRCAPGTAVLTSSGSCSNGGGVGGCYPPRD